MASILSRIIFFNSIGQIQEKIKVLFVEPTVNHLNILRVTVNKFIKLVGSPKIFVLNRRDNLTEPHRVKREKVPNLMIF